MGRRANETATALLSLLAPPTHQSMAVVVGIFYFMYQNRSVYGHDELVERREASAKQTARFNEEMAARAAAAAVAKKS